jgi:UDP-N-acetylglucosamine 2-epimerase (non-hydrolysing)
MDARPILCVFGTRPEAIKMAPVVRALADADGLRPVVCVTGQHHELLEQVLELFRIRPDHRLDVMQDRQGPDEVVARVLPRLRAVLAMVRPAAVVVQGDTTTAFAAALTAFYARIPVGHVEAGLRTGCRYAPFPEELHRRLTTPLADWHFAPTAWARGNLLAEGVADERIVVTGNPVIDALAWSAAQPAPSVGRVLPQLDGGRRLVLVTAHRRETFGRPFEELCAAMGEIAARNPDVELVYPVHPNPAVREPAHRLLGGRPRIHLLAPLDYRELVDVLQRCHLVLTDSGGLQEEAPAFGKPVLVLRDTTERPEGVEAGVARLVGTTRARVVRETERLLRDPAGYARMARAQNPYGDGRAGPRIACFLARALAPPIARRAASA